MRLHHLPRSLLPVISAFLFTTHRTLASPHLGLSALAGFSFDDLLARNVCAGQYCGFSSQLCCTGASTCYTDSNNQAQCGAATAQSTNGYYSYYTTTYTQTDLKTITSVMSTYIGGAVPTATAVCNAALEEKSCGSICCASDQWCQSLGQCAQIANGGSSGYYSTMYSTPTNTAGAPIRPTSSGNVVITTTASPTTTVPFEPPVATGANITLTSTEASNPGLSGGAIAGIVIGVLLALFLLSLLLAFYCCKGILAICGIGRRRRVTEVDEYERRSHHASGGGRRWYGGAAAPSRVPSRVENRKSHEGRNLLGVGAGLAALWAILGLKRKRQERRNEEKYSEYSYDTSYYTSASSASSDDRRTRDTRRSQSRR